MPRFLSLCVIASLLFFAAPVQAQDLLRWETDLAGAQKQAAQTNRLVLVHFWGTWCPPCMEMEKTVFSKPGLGTAISPYFVPVKIQVEQGMNEDLAKQFQVDGYPCDIIMTPEGQIVSKSKGFKPADKYVAMLNQAAQQSLAQARSNGLGPVAAAAPVAAMPVAVAPVAAAAPQAPVDSRYAGFAPPVTSQVAPPMAAAPVAAVAPAVAAVASAPKTDDRYAAYYQSRGLAAPAAPAAAAPTATPAAPTPVAAPSTTGDRYATPAYTAPTNVAVAPVMPAPVAPVAPAAPAVAAPVNSAPVPAAAAPVAPPAAATPAVPTVAANAAPSPAVATGPKSELEAKLPPGSPPLALEGYCPVTVTEKMVWTKGNPLFGAIHLGRTYLFPTAEMQQKFLANPDRYSPIINGNDPVIALEQNQIVPGQRKYGLMSDNKMILFSSKESYDKFVKESKRYTTELQQAMQSSNAVRR